MSNPRNAQRVFIALIVLSIVLVGFVVRPFAEALFFAAVLAGTLYPLQRRLARLLRNRPSLSSGLLCTAVVLALVLPVGGIAAFVVKETVEGVRFVAETVQSDGMMGLIEQLPEGARELAKKALERFPIEEQEISAALQQFSSQGGNAARAVTGALAATGSLVFQTIMMMIALFFLFVDGGSLVSWIERVSPLERGQTTEILVEFRRVSAAVLISSLATAGVQALAALGGFLIAKVPHPIFFTTVTFFFAFIPAVGAGGMCLLAALLLLATGSPWMALFLAIWGVVVVGFVDNIIKPLLAKRGMDMHGAIVFFALLGGLTMFGTAGLIAGPLIVSFFLALVRIYQRDYGSDPGLTDAAGKPVSAAGQGKIVT
ncbi:MAG: AI-2E family transporter [Polyangiales bacterium]